MGYSPWGHKELDMTEQVCTHSLLLEINARILPTQGMFKDILSRNFMASILKAVIFNPPPHDCPNMKVLYNK